jgi:hypothetical protein
MFEETDLVINTESISSNSFLTNPSKPRIIYLQNSYLITETLIGVNQPLGI